MQGRGTPSAPVLVLAPSPRDDDEKLGKTLSGAAGTDVTRNWLDRMGLQPGQVWMTYLLKCHIPQKDKPRAAHLKLCRDLWLEREMTLLNERGGIKAIIALGPDVRNTIAGKPKPGENLPILDPTESTVDFNGRTISVFSLPAPSYFLAVPEHRRYFYNVTLPEVKKRLQAILTAQTDSPQAIPVGVTT
jgi:uracil-DNA glycosylase family 4